VLQSDCHLFLADCRIHSNADVDFEGLAAGVPRQLNGWVGTPDPSKYKEGTNYLSESELAEEVRKGNVVKLDDWVAGLAKMDQWEKGLLYKAMLADWSQNRWACAIT
jgi:hypothetical protein